MIRLKDVINDGAIVEIRELNRALTSPTMYGTILFKGKINIGTISEDLLNREVFRIFDWEHMEKTTYIVY